MLRRSVCCWRLQWEQARAQVPTKRHRVAIMTILELTHRESARLVHKRPFEARPPSR
jgi:hypothetical protein